MLNFDENALKALATEHATAQLLVIEQGKTRFEQNFDPAPVDVFAVQKGLIALLFGIASDVGLVDLDDPINHHLTPSWTKLPPQDEASLTIRTLLTMTSGMSDDLGTLGVVGATWRYNNVAYNYLKKILTTQTALGLNQLTRQWLTGPLDMTDTQWIERHQRLPDGTAFTGLLSTAKDLARLGALVLAEGQHDGSPLVPRWYCDHIAKPGSSENPAWGLCWWNNASAHFMMPMRDGVQEGQIIPSAPPDLIATRGAAENGLYVVPSLGVIVARTARPGQNSIPGSFEQALWKCLCG
tara:strand:- start:244 stop:1131 length:888 start_codon:yes stop_codon:yes gene_type:complete